MYVFISVLILSLYNTCISVYDNLYILYDNQLSPDPSYTCIYPFNNYSVDWSVSTDKFKFTIILIGQILQADLDAS